MTKPTKQIRSEIATCYWGGGRRFFTAIGAARNEAKKIFIRLHGPIDDDGCICNYRQNDNHYLRLERFVSWMGKRLLRRSIQERFVSPFAASSTAEQVLAAREALLVAKANRKAARKAYAAACELATVIDKNSGQEQKFQCLYDDDEKPYWHYSDYYKALWPRMTKQISVYDHPCFKHWRAALNARYEANRLHGIAMRRLLSIGVKRKVAA